MDEHELRRKRLRVFAPSHSSDHLPPSWDDGDQSDSRSTRHTALAPQDSYSHFPYTPVPPPSPTAMARGVSTRFGALNDSFSSKLCVPTAKGKRIEAVDLTTGSAFSEKSASSVDDDGELARRLQAQYDAESSDGQQYSISGASPDSISRVAVQATEATNDDERIARELQAELNGTNDETGPQSNAYDHQAIEEDERVARELQAVLTGASSASASYSNSYQTNGGYEVDTHHSVVGGNGGDAAYARQLQAQYEEERSPASAPLAEASAAQEPHDVVRTVDPLARRSHLLRFAEAVRYTACAACGKPSLSSEKDLLSNFKQWFDKAGNGKSVANVNSALRCSRPFCSAETCLGCGMLSKGRDTGCSVALNDGSTLTWCCTRGRMVLIWILVCGYDRPRTTGRRRDTYFTKPRNSPTKASNGAGVGYDSGRNYHSALKKAKAVSHGKYGTHAPPGSCAQPVEASASSEAADDEITTRLMASLDVLLPSLVAESVQDFDLEPPVVLVAVLTQSNILGTIAALLRNDSLEDATKRMRLYKSTLNVVTKLGSHHATAGPAIHHTRQVQDGGSGILRLSFTSSSAKDEDAKFEEAQSLASCLRNFDKQSKNMLLNAKAHPQAFAGPDTEQMLTLCRGVSELADFLLANAAAAPAAAAAPGGPGQTTPCARDDWQFDLAVLELPDDDIMSRHSYGHLAASAYNLAPGRMKSLSLQLSNLTTSLPPGIFVRHCASRLDVMKILIVGPKGTPYENGLFEFDLFCPSTFPNSPPNMLFRTTGGGRVRFNPNLYNCGKVCLSLLGTWAGEAWSPGKSTILQVLVSIQAMIFCDEPWYNEPGRGTNHSASMDYNRELQGYTVRHAMLDWLKPEPDPVWGDIVERHFANNATAIERMVVGWGIDHATLTQLSYAMGGLGRRGRHL